MINIEKVEKLREKANVTYDEAKTALEASGGDMLDAIIYLERQGKVQPPKNDGSYTFGEKTEPKKEKEADEKCESFGMLVKRFVKWIGKLIRSGNINRFEVTKNGERVVALPVTILVVLVIVSFWITVPLIIIGLFLGYNYAFKGPDFENTGVNDVMKSASNAAEKFKNEIKDGNK